MYDKTVDERSLWKTPVPVCSQKLSSVERGSYLDGWPNPSDQVYYGWRNGAKFTKFIFIHIHGCYCYSRIYLFTFNNKFTFKKYICLHLTTYFLFTNIFTHIYGMYHSHSTAYIRSHLRSKYSFNTVQYSFNIFCALPLRIIRSKLPAS